MEWQIIGRDMHVLCYPSTDSPGSLPIDDSSGGQEISITNHVATGMYDFSTISSHEDAKYIACGNYIAFKDKYGRHRLYTIMTVEGEDTLDVHCEDVGIDLINEDANAWDLTGKPEGVEATLNRVLEDTGWTVGRNEIADRKRATKYESDTDSQLARVGMIMNAFDAECDFEIILDGAKVVKQVVNVYETLGEDLTQQRFIDEDNLTALQRSESIEDLCTCLRCYGKENPDTKQRVTVADIVYDDGRYYSPKGHIRIYDRTARSKWSRFRAFNYEGQGEFDGYINGTFEYDTDSAQELFNRGLNELKSRNEKKVSYEASLYDLQADVGDTVQIASQKAAEPVYLSARVQSVTNHYSVKGEDTGVLANYTLLKSNPSKTVSEQLREWQEQNKQYACSIISSNGTVFKNGEGETTLTARVLDGRKDVTDELVIDWTKDGVELTRGKETIVQASTITGRAVYRFEAAESDGTLRGSCEVTVVDVLDGEKGEKGDAGEAGKDAVLLLVSSVNGYTFKNTGVSTILTVSVIVGDTLIDTSEELRNVFGSGAHIRWECKNVGELEFSPIDPEDPRLSDNGFIFTVSPKDVNNKVTFNCMLNL